jgi:ribosomal RNA assembly protein
MIVESVSIPEDRKAVLIGRLGKNKRNIEKRTATKIEVGDVIEVRGESLDVYRAIKVVKAIGRGFSPPKAFLLLNEDFELDIMSLQGEEHNTIRRLMARVIGRGGTARRKMELKTHTCISIYGKTVSVIGKPEDIHAAHEAIASLLSGAPHYIAYKIADEEEK